MPRPVTELTDAELESYLDGINWMAAQGGIITGIAASRQMEVEREIDRRARIQESDRQNERAAFGGA